MYLVITGSDDGATVWPVGHAHIQKHLRDYDEGTQFENSDWFFDNPDPNYWPSNTVVIIEGSVVQPQSSGWVL